MSHYNYSRQALLITSSNRYEMAVKSALNAVGISVFTENSNLYSLSTIGRVLRTTKNTAFIRGELYKFIQEKGYPYMVIMDMRLDVGLEKEDDPDRMKIMRAFLISYLVFSMGRGFDRLHLNCLLLYDDEDAGIAEKLRQKPVRILGILNTKNPQVNELIAKMKENNSDFNRIFTLRFLAKSTLHKSIDEEITAFKQVIEGKNKMREKALEGKLSSVSNSESEPADAYFLSNGQLYKNGEPVDDDAVDFPMDNGDMVIIGHWNGRTSREVSTRLKRSVSQAIKDKNFRSDNMVQIHLPEKCVIDGSVASVLAGIVISDLGRMPNKKIQVSPYNQPVLSKSQGFNMIKEFVVYQ